MAATRNANTLFARDSEKGERMPWAECRVPGRAPPCSGCPDRILVGCCLGGHKPAWTALLDRYERLIYWAARRNGLSQSQAADVFQNVALILLERLEQLRDVDRIATWICRVTQREASRERRRLGASDADPTALLARQPDDYGDVDALVTRWETCEAVHSALRELPERDRRLIEALYFARPTPRYEEIAAWLGVPIGSIGPMRARSLRKLREIMERRRV
jgi:RNA polymerase sigma factor (sigma-70 family)